METSALLSGGSATTAAAHRDREIGKEDFLKLLVTQLTQQDPLNPQDGTEFVAQLAQFTSLERLVNIEQGLTNVALASAGTNSTMAVSFIGKTVRVQGDRVTLDEKGANPMSYTLPSEAATVSIEVKDASGKVVRTLSGPTTADERHTVAWDGKDGDGKAAPPGEYTFTVTAKDKAGQPITVTPEGLAKVVAVSFKNGFPELVLDNGQTVALGAVTEVVESKDESP